LNQLDVGWWMISRRRKFWGTGQRFCVHRVDLNENVYALHMFTSCIAILFKNIFSIHYEIIYIVDMNERKNHFSFILMHTIHLLHFLVLVCMSLNMNFLFLCIVWHASWDLDLLAIIKFWIFYISCNNNFFWQFEK
jgi:hypothetical protein